MLPYSFYMFNRDGECLQYIEWSRPRQAANAADDAKMVFGLLFSLNAFVSKIDPAGGGGPPPPGPPPPRKLGFQSFRTDTYKLHYLELPSGIQLVLTTEPSAGDLRDSLRHIYGSLYVELVQKSPLHAPGRPFVSEPFVTAVQKYLRAQP